MRYIKLNSKNPGKSFLKEANYCFNNSGVIAHPTETVYGLAVVWDDWLAIQKLCKLKKRPPCKPYSLMVASIKNIADTIGWDSQALQLLIQTIFPGPVTLLLKRKRCFEIDYWNQFEEIGFRVPDNIVCRELVKMAGCPLITTSANIHGGTAPVTAGAIPAEIRKGVDCLLDGGPCPEKIPSTVVRVDFDNQKYIIIREGAFSSERIAEKFNMIWK